MPKRPRKPSSNVRSLKRRPTSEARYEIVFQSKPWEPAVRGLLAELQSLIARSSAVVGDTYAKIAGSVLTRIEAIEDATAERKSRARKNTTAKRSVRAV